MASTRARTVSPSTFEVGGGGRAGVDQEVAVHLRDLRAADPEATAAGGVDQLPGLAAGRIREGRAAGLLADRLGAFAMRLDRVHRGLDRRAVGRRALKTASVKMRSSGARRVAVGEAHLGVGEHMAAALPVDRA